MTTVLPNIKDYTLKELVSDGEHTMIFRAEKILDKTMVIIKLLKPESIIPKNVEQLTYEFNLMSKLNSPYVVKPLELVPIQNSLILVMEDFNGKPLSSLLDEKKWDMLLSLDTAITIASAVGDIHHQNIIHKDIKPQNILINPMTKELKIIDFGIATQLSREMQTVLNPEEMTGSIAYMSPEQTGRINRSVDYRSDIYSLGVTLYQLFTRRLPFEAKTPSELIHMHIALQPQPPNEINEEIPRMLSDIILKCLSKEVEHRYHSAYGLRSDLEKSLEMYLKGGSDDYFEIGTRDVLDHFNYPEKLYGRHKELEFINQCCREVWGGESLLLTLGGYSGVGKSSLVFEAQKYLPKGSGCFAYAKFDQFKHAIPYHGIVQAFQVIINQFLTEPDDILQETKDRILAAVGDSGKVLIDVIPEIELIIGPQPEMEKVSPQENTNRFNFVMVNFLKALLQPDYPLVLFIDDLHWADEPSLKLLELFFSNPTIHNFLVIATYRDNEVTPFHPLNITLKEIVARGGNVKGLTILPLSIDSVQEMIQGTFHGPTKQAKDLTQLLFRKTQGNPFFTLQLLKALYDKELFYFDKERGCWMADLEAIASSQVSDNVADLVIAKLKSLPDSVVDVLKIGATVENRFDLDLLSKVSNLPTDKILQCLNIGMQEDLIQQEGQKTGYIGTKTKNPQQNSPQFYRFLHDRIQQATYSLLNDEERSKLHYAIGKAIVNNTPFEKLGEKSIDIVNHLNAADPVLLSADDKVDLIQMNLIAGNRAKDSAAYLSAIQYFSKGIELLSEDSWESSYKLTLELYQNLALCMMITGGIEKAEALYDLCLEKSKTPLEKTMVYRDLIFLYSQIQQYSRSLEIAEKALKALGYEFDINPSRLSIVKDLLKHKFKMLFRKVENMEKLPHATDKRIQGILLIVAALLYPSMVIGRKNLFVKTGLTIVELSWTHGITKQTSAGLVSLGMVLGSEMFKDYESCSRYGITAHNLALMFPKTVESNGTMYLYYSFIQRWRNPLRNSVVPLKQNFRKILETGASTIAAANAVYINLIELISGKRLDELYQSIQEALMEIKKFTSRSEEMSLMIHREVCLALKGHARDITDPRPSELTDEVLEKSRANVQYVLFTMRYDVWHMVLLYLFGKYKEAVEIGKSCISRIHSFPNWIETHVFYFYYSVALAALLKDPKDNSEYWKQLKKNFKVLKRWGQVSPLNYLHYKLIVEAEMARIEGSPAAVNLYEKAVEAAKESKCTQEIALAYELFGNYYHSKHLKEMGSMLLHKALQYYAQWGADAKCTHFKNVHAEFLSLETFSLSSSHSGIDLKATLMGNNPTVYATSRTNSGDNSDFDVNTLIDASQALSKEIVLDKLMETLMHFLIVNAGADKAFLILFENKKGRVYSQMYLNRDYSPVITPIPIDDKSDDLCLAAIKYVTRTNQTLLLNDATAEGNFRNDPYILNAKPKSLLCLPLIQKGVLAGLLYLENKVSIGAFTPKRLRLLSLLSSQMIISIENAQFYAKLDHNVRERTKELELKNQDLQGALQTIKTVQEQMIQQEKLASLGLLTSGIAHELKNPLNFVINFSQITKELIDEFLDELRNQEKVDPLLLENFEAEVFDSLNKVDSHGHRADDIIKGMLAHARQGSKQAEEVPISRLIDQAFDLALHAIHKKDPGFHVTLEKDLDQKLETILGFPNDLVRIFINIFDNAFYSQHELLKIDPDYIPVLVVKSERKGDNAIITIRDNGAGIPEEIISKIFQPFFSTKPTGSGTGLGLSIVYDIITKQHNGSIIVNSKPGKYAEFVISLPAYSLT